MRTRSLAVSLFACLVASMAAPAVLAVPVPAPYPPPTAGPGKVSIDAFENSTEATVSFNNGAGNLGSENMRLSQFLVTYMNGDYSTVTFQTFCIDLFHTVIAGQSYAVNARADLAGAYANGSRAAYILDNFGSTDLSASPDQAAAVQLALWDLSLGNHNPTFFDGAGGIYSSGDADFIVDFGANPGAAAIAGLVNSYLVVSEGASNTGNWLDAAAAGDAANRGQSLLLPSTILIGPNNNLGPTNQPPPSFNVPEPGTIWVMLVGLGMLGVVRIEGWRR